jgi:DNA-binding transcriptional MerR regulator
LTGYDEIRVETVRRIHVKITESEIVRFAAPGGTTIWVTSVILGVLVPFNDVHHLIVYGITEDGAHVRCDFPEGEGGYPDEIAPLIPALIKAGEDAGGDPDEELLTPGQVAREFGVTISQVGNWDNNGVLKAAFRTPGGDRRFRAADVRRLRGNLPVRSLREDVSTGEITRLRDTQNLTWKQIGAQLGMSGEGARLRYRKARSAAPAGDSEHPRDVPCPVQP